MAEFVREKLTVDGVDTVVYTAGKGDPLVFFHGAGTVDGFDFTEAFASKFRVIAPYHPGFGESGDEASFNDPHDYVLHYLELFDKLGLDAFHLLGLSFGGYLAAKFACEHGHRVKKLAMVAPACLPDDKHPMADILAIPGEQLLPMLVSNFDVLKKRLPAEPDLDFVGARYREATTYARLMWEHPIDFKLPRYLHRLKMPVLLAWGAEDRIVPVQQAETWKKFIPNAQVRIFPGAGHLVQLESAEAVAALQDFLAG
jgi:pimeloyl-ACP methyl ester carboxylesterase